GWRRPQLVQESGADGSCLLRSVAYARTSTQQRRPEFTRPRAAHNCYGFSTLSARPASTFANVPRMAPLIIGPTIGASRPRGSNAWVRRGPPPLRGVRAPGAQPGLRLALAFRSYHPPPRAPTPAPAAPSPRRWAAH